MTGPRPASIVVVVMVAAVTAFGPVACRRAPHGTHVVARDEAKPKAAKAGRWFAFSAGRPTAVEEPGAARATYKPWTVQTRVAGFVDIDDVLYIALNGWGLVTLSTPAGARPADRLRFATYEDRALFAGRTINGVFARNGKVLLHLYRNTVFDASEPRSPPVTYAVFDVAAARLVPIALPPSREGWEAIDVVHTADGRWAMDWKQTTANEVKFRYTLFDPRTGTDQAIDRATFVAAYDFKELARAPKDIRRLAENATAGIESGRTNAGGSNNPAGEVVHLLVRGKPYERTERYRLGSERGLARGNAALLTIPVLRSAGHSYALLPKGRLVWASGDSQMTLPKLPVGYSYTGFWTDGRLLVASWENQQFAEVGPAGLYVTILG